MRWGEKPYHSLDYMLRERFHEKIYKVTLNGGMTCPNRDGTLETAAVSSAVPVAPAISPPVKNYPSQHKLLSNKKRC